MEQLSNMEEKQGIKASEAIEITRRETENWNPKLDTFEANSQQWNIILVDDDDEDRELFAFALEDLRLKARITQFNNGVDLMAYLYDPSSKLPNIIFLDLNMPLMTGEECLSDIRSESRFDKIPVIIYSGYYDELKMETLKKNGADHYFLKPNTLADLKKLIIGSVGLLGKERKAFKDFVIT